MHQGRKQIKFGPSRYPRYFKFQVSPRYRYTQILACTDTSRYRCEQIKAI